MKEIAAAKFKAQCLAILETVDPEGIVITKRGRPIAKLIPLRSAPRELIGLLRDRLKVKGDLLSTGTRWNAES